MAGETLVTSTEIPWITRYEERIMGLTWKQIAYLMLSLPGLIFWLKYSHIPYTTRTYILAVNLTVSLALGFLNGDRHLLRLYRYARVATQRGKVKPKEAKVHEGKIRYGKSCAAAVIPITSAGMSELSQAEKEAETRKMAGLFNSLEHPIKIISLNKEQSIAEHYETIRKNSRSKETTGRYIKDRKKRYGKEAVKTKAHFICIPAQEATEQELEAIKNTIEHALPGPRIAPKKLEDAKLKKLLYGGD